MVRKLLILRLLLLLLLLSLSCNSATPLVDDESGPVEQTVSLDEKADAPSVLRVRAKGMTLWLDPALVSRWETSDNVWVLSGRTSRNLKQVEAFSHSGSVGSSEIVSKRRFELRLSDQELAHFIAGHRLFLSLTPTNGLALPYHAALTLQPRFTRFQGSWKLYLHSWIKSYTVEDTVWFRGRLRTSDPGITMFGGMNDDDSEPLQVRESDTLWRYDWPWWNLLLSSWPVEDGVSFAGEDKSGTRISKLASIEMLVRRVSFTSKQNPLKKWPATTCSNQVLACLQQLEGESRNASGCGTAAQTLACWDRLPEPPAGPIVSVHQFTNDLRSAVLKYYMEFGQDIANAGGNTGPQALLIVDDNKVSLIDDPEENPLGYELSTHLVYSHPDVVFPGSDTVWFGVYDKQDGKLVELTNFQ